jgi:D-beta-D-heptose 7-phosphate kinase / D-beta-D-heptose 1-phosphate adenosyltransferase
MDMDRARAFGGKLRQLLDDHFQRAPVLVVGDLMLDRYLDGSTGRISQEAPVLVMRHQRERLSPGGAGNVARNLAGLGLSVHIIGTVGKDRDGEALLELLAERGIKSEGVVPCPARPTTTKCRVTSGSHQLLRIDTEETTDLPAESTTRLLQQIERAIDLSPRAIVLSDYAKGVVTKEVAQAVITLGRRLTIPVLVDPKGADWNRYCGATMVSPNRIELAEATGVPALDLDRLLNAGEAMRRDLGISFLAVTLGEQGIVLLHEDDRVHLPSRAREVFDVSGAGDTVVATIAAALIAGAGREEALELANLAAGIVVGKVGTVPIEFDELRDAAARVAGPGLRYKICSTKEAARRAECWRRQGEKFVFTNGCFDLIHAGHALHLEEARQQGDRLIIGLNSDSSIRGLKGPTRPIQCQDDRAVLLASMSAVDAIVIFEEPTPLNLVVAIRPDVMVKGNDYAKSAIAGAAEVESWGGRVVTLPLVAGRSTSSIIERIQTTRGAMK